MIGLAASESRQSAATHRPNTVHLVDAARLGSLVVTRGGPGARRSELPNALGNSELMRVDAALPAEDSHRCVLHVSSSLRFRAR